MIQLLKLSKREDSSVTDWTSLSFEFPACRKRRVAADFSGGEITGNGGGLLLRQPVLAPITPPLALAAVGIVLGVWIIQRR